MDLLVLKTLGEMNGYRIVRLIEQVGPKLSQGAIYPALARGGDSGESN